jgi:predicted anti-sigma-YlaC factor YlaD
MTPCDTILVRVWEYLDGAASSGTVRLINMHLARCPDCHAQYTFQQAFLRSLRRAASPRSRDER